MIYVGMTTFAAADFSTILFDDSVIVITVFAIGLCIMVMIEGVDYQLTIFIDDVEGFPLII